MKHYSFKMIPAVALALFFIIATGPRVWAEQSVPVLSEKFDDAAAVAKRFTFDPKQWRVENGVLKTVENNMQVVGIELGTNLSDFSIEFDARIVKVNAEGHFGVGLRSSPIDGKASSGMIYCWPYGALGYVERVPNEQGRNIAVGTLPQKPVIGAASPFIHFRYVCIGKLIHIYANNQFVATI